MTAVVAGSPEQLSGPFCVEPDRVRSHDSVFQLSPPCYRVRPAGGGEGREDSRLGRGRRTGEQWQDPGDELGSRHDHLATQSPAIGQHQD
jgi:hypothetical protein